MKWFIYCALFPLVSACSGELTEKHGESCVSAYAYRLREADNGAGVRIIAHDQDGRGCDIIAIPIPDTQTGYYTVLAREKVGNIKVKFVGDEYKMRISPNEYARIAQSPLVSDEVRAFLAGKVDRNLQRRMED